MIGITYSVTPHSIQKAPVSASGSRGCDYSLMKQNFQAQMILLKNGSNVTPCFRVIFVCTRKMSMAY